MTNYDFGVLGILEVTITKESMLKVTIKKEGGFEVTIKKEGTRKPIQDVERLKNRLEDHLGFKFFQSKNLTYLEEIVRDILNSVITGQVVSKLDDTRRLWAFWNMFCDDLDRLKGHYSYTGFLESFIKNNAADSRDLGNIMGDKFEAHVGRGFIDRQYQFIKSAKSVKPDLVVDYEGVKLGAECTTSWFKEEERTFSQVIGKLRGTIKKKNKQYKYNGSSIMLWIEVSHISVIELRNERFPDFKLFLDEVEDCATNIGAIVFSSFYHLRDEERCAYVFGHRLTKNASNELKSFWANYESKGDGNIKNPHVLNFYRNGK
jgi:hypothetical protein